MSGGHLKPLFGPDFVTFGRLSEAAIENLRFSVIFG